MSGVAVVALLAAICGLVAASYWVRFATTSPASIARSRRLIEHSAMATAGALGLASVAVLLVLYAAGA
jgi:hypothetical protein